jgi:hypothetical protein
LVGRDFFESIDFYAELFVACTGGLLITDYGFFAGYNYGFFTTGGSCFATGGAYVF